MVVTEGIPLPSIVTVVCLLGYVIPTCNCTLPPTHSLTHSHTHTHTHTHTRTHIPSPHTLTHTHPTHTHRRMTVKKRSRGNIKSTGQRERKLDDQPRAFCQRQTIDMFTGEDAELNRPLNRL